MLSCLSSRALGCVVVALGAVLPACADDSLTGGGGGGGGVPAGGDGSGGDEMGGAAEGGGGGVMGTCAGVAPVDGSALLLDGVDDHVSMGVAPELGLEQFTLEAWVRRDGVGEKSGTGVGGLTMTPIVGKGRGEADGSNVDCNYSFGFFGDVLGADFEDAATGGNHPVVGTIPVPIGSWHHVAASYDGSSWRLYVDGVLDVESVAGATPRADSIQHFGIGASFDSAGTPAGRLHGAVDELRVWDHARTDAEISAGAYVTIEQGTGLVGRFRLDASDAGALDSAGPNDGTISGATFVEPGATLDRGLPPLATGQSTLNGNSAELSVTTSDAESDELIVTFYLRELSEADDFTVVVLPDTQYYTVQGDDLEHYFYEQTKWVIDNREAYDIAFVIHNGDIVDNGALDYQWSVAETALTPLETPLPRHPDGIPYGLGVGNHDQSPIGTTGSTTKFNQHFGVDRFEGRSYYGGHHGMTNDDNWATFNAGGLDFVVVNLQFDKDADPAVLAWARSIFESHPDAFGILNSHYLTNGAAAFGPQGQAIYDTLRDVDNVQLMTCGHISNESLRTDDFEGNVIHTMLADYQFDPDGGSGYMRIWEFSPANDELTVRTYSPTLDLWMTDEDSEFTLKVDLDGSGSAFAQVGLVDPASGVALTTVPGLTPGRTYEWYASVSDCVQTSVTPVYSFTTPP